MNVKNKCIVLFLLLFLIDITSAFAQEPIVYSRCERTTANFELTGDVTINGVTQTVTRTMTGLDIYDRLPDVTNFLSKFTAPCDLVYRDAAGVEQVIYDCSTNSSSTASCAALDPAVSFDGKTIAFSVFHGSLQKYKETINSRVLHPDADSASLGWIELPNNHLITIGAHLHFYDIATGEVRAIPFEAGIYDSGPAFVSNTRIAFTSTRDGHATTLVWGTGTKREGTRIWTMDTDGRNLDLASHHSLSQEQHPYPLKDGRLAYSSWQIFGGLPFRRVLTGTGAGSFATIDNLFHIYTQAPDGAKNFPLYGQHSGDHSESTFGENHVAAHYITQTSDERVWFADYYRGNNSGLGVLVGVVQEPEGMEGMNPYEATQKSDMYIPHDVINFASWAHNGDFTSSIMPEPQLMHPSYTDPLPFAGKVGHPAALTNNGLMLSWGKGACSTNSKSKEIFTALGKEIPPVTSGIGSGQGMNLITSLEMDTPGCDIGIYRATTIPSRHPSDLEMIVDSPDWHEIMARAVIPYADIHGVETPKVIPAADQRVTHTKLETGTPFGLLGAASITDRETHPRDGIHFVDEQQFNLQGTDNIDYLDEDLCGVRILGIMPNRYKVKKWNRVYETLSVAGERVSILGEFSVKNRDSNGNIIMDPSGHADTSFLVRMPANTPYLMQAIDCDGRTLNTDQTWQSLRPGEVKTCDGCHVHSRPARTTFDQTFAATSGYTIPQIGEGSVPLLAGAIGDTVQTRTVPGYGVQVDFTRDILPIFEQRCASCHGGVQPEAGLALDRPGTLGIKDTTTPSTWWCLVADLEQACVAPENVMTTNAGKNGVTFRRPQLTRYLRAFNSRGSLLYWKAANARVDNRTDDSYSDDIDFGKPHPTDITPDELGLISRWIDLGAAGGAEELVDTQKPTLHLAAQVQNGAVTGVNVGTVDLGSGIDTNSLVVCVRNTDGSCNNIAGPAEMHGITTVSLGSVGDANTEIFASVKDLTGNITEVSRTVGWLLNSRTINFDAGSIIIVDPKLAVSDGGSSSTDPISTQTEGSTSTQTEGSTSTQTEGSTSTRSTLRTNSR